jgi:hypothetical protein
MSSPGGTVGGASGEWEASPMVVSLLTPKTPSQRTDDHHFAYPVVRPLPRPPAPAASHATW